MKNGVERHDAPRVFSHNGTYQKRFDESHREVKKISTWTSLKKESQGM